MSKWKYPLAARTVAAVAVCALVAACGDQSDTPVAPTSTAPAQVSREQASVNEITRLMSVALQDPAVRQRVFDDLRASRFSREHKLEFRAYLQGEGSLLLERLAEEKTARGGNAAGAREAVLDALGSLPPLEFYMPVPEHRAAWTGGADLIVANQIVKDANPVGYMVGGRPVALNNATPPATPVLVLVTQENTFKEPMPAQYSNADDQGGRALGTLARPGETNIHSRARYSDGTLIGQARGTMIAPEECDPTTAITECSGGSSGGGGAAPSYPAGVYFDALHLNDLRESWTRGDAEVEAFVIGPTFYPTSQGEIISCSGQGGSGPKYFDQNNNDWVHSSWSVAGQLLTKDEVSHYFSVYAAPWSVQLWEDDDSSCEIVYSDRSALEQLYDQLRNAYRATTLLVQVATGHILLDAATGNAIRNAINGAFQSDDDFIGNVVYKNGTSRTDSWGDTYVDADVYREGMTYNGYVTIRTSDTDHPH